MLMRCVPREQNLVERCVCLLCEGAEEIQKAWALERDVLVAELEEAKKSLAIERQARLDEAVCGFACRSF